MSSKKRNSSVSISRKKRCKNGSRRDIKSGECISFMPFTTFDQLNEQEIASEGITISIESLENDGGIAKIYNNKVILGQKLIDKSTFEKAKKKTKTDFKRILKIIKRSKKTPNFIEKDKAFQQFLKKQEKSQEKAQEQLQNKKYGGTKTMDEHKKPKIIVQSKVIDKMSNATIDKLKDKISLLERSIRITSIINNRDWWSYLSTFNLFELIGLTIQDGIAQSAIKDINQIAAPNALIQIPASNTLSNTIALNAQINTLINPIITYDFAGGFILMLLDMLNTYFPSSTLAYMTQIAQYIYWSWLIGSTYFILMPINIWWGLAAIIPFLASIIHSVYPMPIYKLEDLEHQLANAKNELAKEIEKISHSQ
jgi:hypothetical protein